MHAIDDGCNHATVQSAVEEINTVSMIASQRTVIMSGATVVCPASVKNRPATASAKGSEYVLLRASLKAGQVGWSPKQKGVSVDGGVVGHGK